jgi:hypothetical protein
LLLLLVLIMVELTAFSRAMKQLIIAGAVWCMMMITSSGSCLVPVPALDVLVPAIESMPHILCLIYMSDDHKVINCSINSYLSSST